MRILLAATALALALTGCAMTPLQQCEAPHRSELRIVQDDIRDVRLALKRGFRLVPARWDHGVNYCVRASGSVYRCREEDGEPMFDKRRISRAAEQAKLAALLQERARLNAALAACAARFAQTES